jgi:Fe-S-cluster containining protein
MLAYPVNLATAYGRLRTNLIVSEDDMGLAAFMRSAISVGQELVDLMEAAYERAGKPASCAKGCASCCRQEVPISAPEALLLAECAAALPDARRQGVAVRFQAIRDRVRAGNAGGRDLPTGTGSAEAKAHVKAQGLAWFRERLDCPFLENEACVAHEDRPFTCRNHLAFTEARHCFEPETGQVRVMNPRFSIGTVMALLAAEFMGEEPVKLPLAALEDWIRMHPEYAARRFPSGELANRFLGLLEDFTKRSLPVKAAAPAASPTPAPAPSPL